MRRIPTTLRRVAWLAGLLALLAPGPAGHAEDSVLFSTAVAPNVMLIMDNSGSMNNTVWHPAFDPTVDPTCDYYTDTTTYTFSSDLTFTRCGKTINLYFDPSINSNTRILGRYLNWLFSPESDSYTTELEATNNGTTSACLQAEGQPATYPKYRGVSRVQAARRVLREVICQVNAKGDVRFGMARFRTGSDPEGGYVVVPIDDYDAGHGAALESAIVGLEGEAWTPLAETLYDVYRYFQSRSNPALGADGVEMPRYEYETDGDTDFSDAPPSPVEYSCQKHFVLLITDGEPTRDDFDGFPPDTFLSRIGNYNPDDVNPEAGSETSAPDEGSYYLDDLAMFMNDPDNDFHRDMDETQTIDVYTVGFTTSPTANAILQKTADVGNGQFFFSNNAEELADAIIDAISDIIEKSQAFTSATVPATRTEVGGNFYSSFFIPSSKNPFWEGHIRNFTINSPGEILDRFDNCALDDPSGNCLSGPFLSSAEPHWDAADEMPAPGSRNLEVSIGGSKTTFTASRATTATEMGVTYPPTIPYTGSNASNAEELADELVDFLRGCEFGTRLGTDCQERVETGGGGDPITLGDVFHSDPVVIGPPSTAIFEPSYVTFATQRNGADGQPLAQRQRVLVAGANDGFLHGFDAGTVSSGSYNRGTGVEEFAFMPWYVRTTVKNLPIDLGGRSYYFVDGSPSVADVWLYGSRGDDTKDSDGSEWATVLVGGLRQGGPIYYALDVTDPSSGSYPEYLWEFPQEGETGGFAGYNYMEYMGETWSEPVIVRVRVNVSGESGVFERWVAIVGAGYDESSDPNHVDYDDSNDTGTSRKGRGVFMIDIKTGRVLAAEVYHHDNSLANGHPEMRYGFASTPAPIDSDFDGYADVVYIGDLGGNVWKWVIRDPGDDRVNTLPFDQADKSQSSWTFGKFFSAQPATIGTETYYKSFFYAPALTYYGQDLWIAMGTGERAAPSFPGADASDDSENNRVYALKDPDPYGLPSPTYTDGDLADYTSLEGCVPVTDLGYYLVAREGEKFLTEVDISGFFVTAGTFIPDPSGDPCEAGGSASFYAFKVYCGEGLWPENTGADERRVDLGPGMPTSPRLSLGEVNRIYIMTSENELKTPRTPPLPDPSEGMLYWRERQLD